MPVMFLVKCMGAYFFGHPIKAQPSTVHGDFKARLTDWLVEGCS